MKRVAILAICLGAVLSAQAAPSNVRQFISGSRLTGTEPSAVTYYVATTGSDSNTCEQAKNTSTPKRNIMGAGGGLACLTAGAGEGPTRPCPICRSRRDLWLDLDPHTPICMRPSSC